MDLQILSALKSVDVRRKAQKRYYDKDREAILLRKKQRYAIAKGVAEASSFKTDKPV